MGTSTKRASFCPTLLVAFAVCCSFLPGDKWKPTILGDPYFAKLPSPFVALQVLGRDKPDRFHLFCLDETNGTSIDPLARNLEAFGTDGKRLKDIPTTMFHQSRVPGRYTCCFVVANKEFRELLASAHFCEGSILLMVNKDFGVFLAPLRRGQACAMGPTSWRVPTPRDPWRDIRSREEAELP